MGICYQEDIILLKRSFLVPQHHCSIDFILTCIKEYLCHQNIFLILDFLLKSYFIFKDFIYLFLERGEGRKKKRKRDISVWLPLKCPHWGPGPQPRHVP